MAKARFDVEAFYAALDEARQSRKMSWKALAGEAEISPSTLTRMAQGKRPDVDSLAALASWSGLSADDFVRSGTDEPAGEVDPIAKISTYLRADRNLSPETADAMEKIMRGAYTLAQRMHSESRRDEE